MCFKLVSGIFINKKLECQLFTPKSPFVEQILGLSYTISANSGVHFQVLHIFLLASVKLNIGSGPKEFFPMAFGSQMFFFCITRKKS